MPNYLPSLEERLNRLIEDCCGGVGGGGGEMQDGPGAEDPPTADSEGDTLINRTLNKLKTKRKMRKTDGP